MWRTVASQTKEGKALKSISFKAASEDEKAAWVAAFKKYTAAAGPFVAAAGASEAAAATDGDDAAAADEDSD